VILYQALTTTFGLVKCSSISESLSTDSTSFLSNLNDECVWICKRDASSSSLVTPCFISYSICLQTRQISILLVISSLKTVGIRRQTLYVFQNSLLCMLDMPFLHRKIVFQINQSIINLGQYNRILFGMRSYAVFHLAQVFLGFIWKAIRFCSWPLHNSHPESIS
jgi:hypothetical protein